MNPAVNQQGVFCVNTHIVQHHPIKRTAGVKQGKFIISLWKSTHDRVVASRDNENGLPEYIGREVALMTAYEIISIFIGYWLC